MSDKSEIVHALMGDPKQWKMILERAIIDEYDAIQFYDEMIAREPAAFMREVFEEIRKDEWNHVGRLQDLLKGYMSEQEMRSLKLGMRQEEI